MAVTRRYRVGGSGYTVFTWNGTIVGSARQTTHTSPTAVGPGPTPIHPLDVSRPVEIITPAAISMGELQLEIYELYGKTVWHDLSTISGSVDLAVIFKKVADSGNGITLSKFIYPPAGNTGDAASEGLTNFSVGSGGEAPSRGGKHTEEQYHNVVITNVLDGETIEIGTMEVMKRVEVAYTHMTRAGYSD